MDHFLDSAQLLSPDPRRDRRFNTKRVFRVLAASSVAASVFLLLPTAASAACQAYRLLPKFAIKQSNGIPVTLSLKASRRGEVNGSAHYMSGSDFRRTVGEIEGGSFDGRVLKFNIVWSGSAPATYKGAIDEDGKLSGSARWGGKNTATFDSIQTFLCRS